jgi:predicted PurR-regulated permease PerM
MIKTLILKQNRKILIMAAFSVIFYLLISYIFQINNLVSKSYSLQSYQKNIEKISSENDKMESNLAGVGSLQNAEARILGLGFEKIIKIHYIQILENTVASAQ